MSKKKYVRACVLKLAVASTYCIKNKERNTIDFDGNKEAQGPKDGIVDGKEHHGGNRFEGGTGGADTVCRTLARCYRMLMRRATYHIYEQPGMGGKSGAYRVDGGDDIYQIEEAKKGEVSEKVREAQRAMRQVRPIEGTCNATVAR
jgi:hypothetical protein